MGVAVSNAAQQLFHDDSGVFLAELTTIDNLVEELTTLDVISHDVETLFIFEVLVDLDDVGVIESP